MKKGHRIIKLWEHSAIRDRYHSARRMKVLKPFRRMRSVQRMRYRYGRKRIRKGRAITNGIGPIPGLQNMLILKEPRLYRGKMYDFKKAFMFIFPPR